VCAKSGTLLVSEFSTLVRCIVFAIFVYLLIIFIKCLIFRSSAVSTDGLSSRMVLINYLKGENVSFIKPQMWPPNSPYLNPVDYAVWGALQQQV